ncbi:unnamed protein product [Effrenium voratum]|nr:unnamed protein product [Effrenium voratum]
MFPLQRPLRLALRLLPPLLLSLVIRWFLRRRKPVSISVALRSAYAQEVALAAARQLGVRVEREASTQWADFDAIDWDAFFDGRLQRCSSLYVRASLVRKGMLAHYLAKKRFAGVMPPTLVADVEDEDDLQKLPAKVEKWAASCDPTHLVVKASNANRGEHIFLVRTAAEVASAVRPSVQQGVKEWVVQPYIRSLLEGRKFHLRCHFLMVGCPFCGTSRAWLHSQAVALLASEVFTEDLARTAAHLTNHCIQEAHPDYDEARQIRVQVLAEPVRRQVASSLQQALASCARTAGFWPLPQCFELFAADFLLEGSEPKAWLLEINSGPDLGVFGKNRAEAQHLAADVLRTAVLPFRKAAGPTWEDPAHCSCRLHGSGFATELWSCPPSAASCAEELRRFQRRLGLAASWAKALHGDLALRGPQASVAAAAAATARPAAAEAAEAAGKRTSSR